MASATRTTSACIRRVVTVSACVRRCIGYQTGSGSGFHHRSYSHVHRYHRYERGSENAHSNQSTSSSSSSSSCRDNEDVARVVLKEGKARALRASSHPLVYAKSVARITRGEFSASVVHAGEPVIVTDGEDKPIGWGVFNGTASMYAVRILESGSTAVDIVSRIRNVDELRARVVSIIKDRIQYASELRKHSIMPSIRESNAFRVINAEGDGLSGITADVYDGIIVVMCSAAWIEAYRTTCIDAILASVQGAMSVEWRRSSQFLELEQPTTSSGMSEKEEVEQEADEKENTTDVWVSENGIEYLVSPSSGQKTGHYCDQRENRATVRSLARGGKTVLDLCCYTGGFSLAAAVGGASRVVGVDSSETALERARVNAQRNGVESTCTFVKQDITEFMRKAIDGGKAASYDIVILDPPKLAPGRRHMEKALRKYKRLNELAMRMCKGDGGLLLSFSCSGVVAADHLLPGILREAAVRTETRLHVMQVLGAGPDHPYSVSYPEGNYLSGILAAVRRASTPCT